MKQNRKFDLFLEDMLEAINRIQEYIGNSSFENFKKDRMAVDAVIRNFEIIGEASKNIPEYIWEKYPEIPWQKMYRLRNIIAHEYFGIDHEMIWEVATKHLPLNKADLKRIIKKEKGH